jgi:hypothetical protein
VVGMCTIKSYAIGVHHTRPPRPDNITFLNIYHIKSDADASELKKVFTMAFKEDHPGWPIKQVKVEQE